MVVNAELPDLTPAEIQSRLRTRSLGRSLEILAQVDSTNSAAFALAERGALDGTVLVADAQTAGRGRQRRAWHSPPGTNLYFSLICRVLPGHDRLAKWLSWLPLATGLGLVSGVQAHADLQTNLKWPNDLLLLGRKLGGVLCESTGLGTRTPVVVVGIGLNVNVRSEAFPEDLRSVATSLTHETGRAFHRGRLLADLLEALEPWYDALANDQWDSLARHYTGLCATLGRVVSVTLASGEVLEGRAESIAEDGSLVVRSAKDDRLVALRTGDVKHVR